MTVPGVPPRSSPDRSAGILNLTSGDSCGGSLAKSGVPGEVLVWHDVLYDGPRRPGWPDEGTLMDRAVFLSQATGGGLSREKILLTLRDQYRRLETADRCERVVLWFDACLFDQAMLAHVLTCLRHQGVRNVELLCVDAFPGIDRYHGLGQLTPAQMASVYDRRRPVTEAQFIFAAVADRAFALRDRALLTDLARQQTAALPWVPAAAARWLQEWPDPATGLGRLEALALEAVKAGHATPAAIFTAVAAKDTPPQFWGDTTLWARINGLANRVPPLVRIEGPAPRLPQWDGVADLKRFRVLAADAPVTDLNPG